MYERSTVRGLVRHICLAALLLAAIGGGVPAAALDVGAYAPPLEVPDLGGVSRNVVWGEGGPSATILYFFDPQASDCLLELGFIDAVYERARDFGLAVYAVEAKGRQPAEVRRVMERYCSIYREPSFPVLPDPSFRLARVFGVGGVPATFVAESHGVILNRVDGYDHEAAVAIVQRLEQLLRRERGFFATALREAGVSEAEEGAIRERTAAAAAVRASPPSKRALGAGDRSPELEFVDTAGRTGRWSWSGGEGAPGMRIVAFFAGFSINSVDELRWLGGMAARGRDAGLEVLAVETGGMDTAALRSALERYRRYNPDLPFPVVADTDGKLALAFGPWEQVPQTYLLAADGTVAYVAEGFGAGEAEILTGKVERAYLQAGRPFPSARPGGDLALPAGEEEAPSIRKRQAQDEAYRSGIVQGDAAFMAWDFEAALRHYRAALAVQPKDLHALVRVAQIHDRRGESGPALEYWERVLAVRPEHAEAVSRVRELRPPR